MAVSIEKIAFGGWPNCYRVSNGIIDLVATSDVGPRVVRLGFLGEKNEFAEFAEQSGVTGSDEWLIYGGHRLWHSPEAKPRTYWPDSKPIKVTEKANGLILEQPTEPTTGIRKTIEVTMDPDEPRVVVLHRLVNEGLWDVELAIWALSVMAPGGVAVSPVPTEEIDEEGLLPNRVLILWPYTDMADARWGWGRKYVMLRQDVNCEGPQKFGLSNSAGWGVYANGGTCFVKYFELDEEVFPHGYPDGGASIEIYTNNRMLELETVGPITVLSPGCPMEHTEVWELRKGIPEIVSEADVDAYILPIVAEG